MPNQIYSLNPSTIIVTSSFEENVKKGQYYCDYRAKLMQLLMRAQLDQWAARYFAPPPVSGVTRILPQKEMLSHTIAPSNQPVRTRIELDIDPSGGGNMDSILLRKRLSSVA